MVMGVVVHQQLVAVGRAAWQSVGVAVTGGGAVRPPTWLQVPQ